jgi:16S rRNA (guanine527-N7)-methyltransferase
MSATGRHQQALQALTRRYDLNEETATKLACLLELLARDPQAPTTVREPHQAIKDHLADSLVALEMEVVRAAKDIVDLGSGAGFPGLPLALALPAAEVCLIDSGGRKASFVERAVDACAIGNAYSVHARVEDWPDGIGRFDLVTARALASLDVVAEYAAPLLRLGGTLAAWRGRRDPEVEAAAARAAPLLGLEVGEIRPVEPYPGAEHRHIHLMTKVGETPERFPRRPGMARKRPLGASRPAV